MLNIEETKNYKIAIHHLGFRPFFLGAMLYSIFAVVAWTWLYHIDISSLLPQTYNPTTWHAHEMVFGYTFAVIAGFLLTAVRNWTNIQTIHGLPLIFLAVLWLGARVLAFVHVSDAATLMALLDLGFNLVLIIVLTIPVIKSRQWQQMGIILIVLLLGLMNAIYYLGMFDQLPGGTNTGIYGGLYVSLLLIMVMARRVIPFFIEKGIDQQVTITNRSWLDISSIVLMLVYITLEVFWQQPKWAAGCAFVLFILQMIRLYDWYTPGLWKKSLLWSLYIAYLWLTLGFGLRAAGTQGWVNPMLAVHAFAYGAIGLMTLSMMSRVTLGHTGRNVFQPPTSLHWIFIIFLLGIISRVILPMFFPQHYSYLIGVSQIFWIIAFSGFAVIFASKLILPRIDGRYG